MITLFQLPGHKPFSSMRVQSPAGRSVSTNLVVVTDLVGPSTDLQ